MKPTAKEMKDLMLKLELFKDYIIVFDPDTKTLKSLHPEYMIVKNGKCVQLVTEQWKRGKK